MTKLEATQEFNDLVGDVLFSPETAEGVLVCPDDLAQEIRDVIRDLGWALQILESWDEYGDSANAEPTAQPSTPEGTTK